MASSRTSRWQREPSTLAPKPTQRYCGSFTPGVAPRRYSPSLLQPFSGSGRQASRGNTRRWGALSARVPATTMWNCRAMASEEVTASTLRSGWWPRYQATARWETAVDLL